ncbi:hypothetical protein EV693_10225 [Nicoletella semolina]|uniref:Uncharacterized protein n=1 Tax=Nicoletella semolina TaxID=271160 RepID=A0A4R2NBD8_9PAST|nr:hypothetical protein [Nicoletella semolina]TCP18348.1 hypothetical protein EV693_10225 [Nicoletella semolina]
MNFFENPIRLALFGVMPALAVIVISTDAVAQVGNINTHKVNNDIELKQAHCTTGWQR